MDKQEMNNYILGVISGLVSGLIVFNITIWVNELNIVNPMFKMIASFILLIPAFCAVLVFLYFQ